MVDNERGRAQTGRYEALRIAVTIKGNESESNRMQCNGIEWNGVVSSGW